MDKEVTPSRKVIQSLHNRQLGFNKQTARYQPNKKYAKEVQENLKGFVKASQNIKAIDLRLTGLRRQISNARANREASWSYQGLVTTRDNLIARKDRLRGFYHYV